MDHNAPLTEAEIRRLIALFYARVRADALIGTVFNQAIHNWPEHLEKLSAFWSSVMLGSRRYKGNPVAMHMRHQATITPAMFDRWLLLWAQTTNETMPPTTAAALQEKAARIAESLKLTLFFKFDSSITITAAPHPEPTKLSDT